MRREIMWAGIIGISFGLVIAFGAWRINSSFKLKSPTTSSTPTPNPGEATNITLDKPENGDVEITNTVTVSGITKPLSWMVFSGESGDYIIQSGEGGVFSQDVGLISGVNQIKVTLLDESGNQTFQKVLVVYSASFQPNLTPPSTSRNATDDSAIQADVDQKVAAALNKPKAYLGTVTDIADSTVEIKSMESSIEQIAASASGVVVVNTKGNATKTVKLTDIAIGDFIVAMGYVNQKSVLTAQRILVTDPVAEPKIDISMAKVTDTSKKTITISDLKNGGSVVVTPDKNTDLESYASGKTSPAKITAINKNDIVICVTDNTGTPAIVRSIFDIGI